jgi:hypothetical protein
LDGLFDGVSDGYSTKFAGVNGGVRMGTIKQRITSRKFLAMVVAFVAGLLALLHVDMDTITQVVGLLTVLVAAVAYIFTEGSIDKASAGADTYTMPWPWSDPDMLINLQEARKKKEAENKTIENAIIINPKFFKFVFSIHIYYNKKNRFFIWKYFRYLMLYLNTFRLLNFLLKQYDRLVKRI